MRNRCVCILAFLERIAKHFPARFIVVVHVLVSVGVLRVEDSSFHIVSDVVRFHLELLYRVLVR